MDNMLFTKAERTKTAKSKYKKPHYWFLVESWIPNTSSKQTKVCFLSSKLVDAHTNCARQYSTRLNTSKNIGATRCPAVSAIFSLLT